MNYGKLNDALRRKFRTPAEAIRALGLDANLITDPNTGTGTGRVRTEPAKTPGEGYVPAEDDDGITITYETVEKIVELLQGKCDGGTIEEVRRLLDGGMSMDAPEPFPGRPNPGGRLDPAMDAKQRAASVAHSTRTMASFAERFPQVARVKSAF